MSKMLIYTELSYKLDKYKEVHNRIYFSAISAIQHSLEYDTFLYGAYLRMILDAAVNLFIVNCLSDLKAKERFIDYWMSGKPINKYKVKAGDEWVQLSSGYIQRTIPAIGEMYKALNPMIHPSKDYLERIFKESDGKVYLDRDVPTGEVSDYGVMSFFNGELEKIEHTIAAIQPTSTEYRELEYSDSLKEATGEAPDIFRIYKE